MSVSLCTAQDLLRRAQERRQAVGAFNVGSMEMLLGAVQAAEAADTPIILQIAEKRLGHSPLRLMGPMMVSAAQASPLPMAVQLDHGSDPEIIRQALEMGFTGIMYDGSSLPLAENIANTRRVVALCAPYGASVEAEIGSLGGSEGGPEGRSAYSDPAEARELVAQTGCDALAIAIGNAHGHYKGKPRLNFEVLARIHEDLRLPLVLHGGTGIPDGDFRRAITLGVCKINIATANFDALTLGAKTYLDQAQSPNYFDLNQAMVAGVTENVRRHIDVFNN